MTDAIEMEVKQLRADFASLAQLCLRQNGETHAYRSALLALITSHPRSDALDRTFRDELARTEARVVHECESEDYLEGMQSAQKLLLLALDESNKRQTLTSDALKAIEPIGKGI
jgi:hypothetical protein